MAKTVNVNNAVGRALVLHLHETIPDDGGGRPFHGRVTTEPVMLNPGHNAGIDAAFFAEWRKQNPALFVDLLTAEDET